MRGSVPKICPRCGAFYENLGSKTCPQCFAKLDSLAADDATGLIAEQERRSKDPDFVRRKSVDDESYKEQSFGACLAIGGIIVGVLAVSAALCMVAVRHHAHIRPPGTPSTASSANREPQLRMLPGDYAQIIPAWLAGIQRTQADTGLAVPQSSRRILHATYGAGLQIYALATPSPTQAEAEALSLAAAAAAQQHSPPLIEFEIATKAGIYEIDASSAVDAKRAASELVDGAFARDSTGAK